MEDTNVYSKNTSNPFNNVHEPFFKCTILKMELQVYSLRETHYSKQSKIMYIANFDKPIFSYAALAYEIY